MKKIRQTITEELIERYGNKNKIFQKEYENDLAFLVNAIVDQQMDDRNYGILFFMAGYDGKKQDEYQNLYQKEFGIDIF